MIAPALALLLAATPPTLSVEQVVARHVALAGQTVLVAGRLTACRPLSCAIMDGEAGISLGANRAFDQAIAGLAGRRAVIEALVTDRCWADPQPDGDITICTDRANQLHPIRLVRTYPPKD